MFQDELGMKEKQRGRTHLFRGVEQYINLNDRMLEIVQIEPFENHSLLCDVAFLELALVRARGGVFFALALISAHGG